MRHSLGCFAFCIVNHPAMKRLNARKSTPGAFEAQVLPKKSFEIYRFSHFRRYLASRWAYPILPLYTSTVSYIAKVWLSHPMETAFRGTNSHENVSVQGHIVEICISPTWTSVQIRRSGVAQAPPDSFIVFYGWHAAVQVHKCYWFVHLIANCRPIRVVCIIMIRWHASTRCVWSIHIEWSRSTYSK